MNQKELYTLGIDIGSTTVKIAILDENNEVVFSDYDRHFANIQETLSDLLGIRSCPCITGHHRFRRTDTCETPWSTIRTGSYRRINCSSGLCTSDRRCYRAWRGRCQDHLLRRRQY